jgi:hypothetical protein
MKRILPLIAALALAVGLGVAGVQPNVSLLGTVSHTVVNPDGKVVRTLPPLPSKTPGKDTHVAKGMPRLGGIHTNVATGCDGVGTNPCFLYNIGSQGSLTKNGGSSLLRIGGHTGTLDTTNDWHSLGEFAAMSSNQQQIVEVGYTVDPAVNKTGGVGVTTPRPFVFSWVNGVAGVYNGGAFVPTAGVSVVPGVTNLTPGAYITVGIWHDDTQHLWWIKWGTEWIGYYPDTQWSGATPPATFVQMQKIQLFGEIASAKSKSCSDFGMGITPVNGTNTTPASFSSTTYWNSALANDTTSVNLALSVSPSGTAGPPEADVKGAGAIPSTTNLRSFYWGGPGWNAAGTGVGTAGAC